MTLDPTALLSLLGSGVRALSGDRADAPPGADIASASFTDLLDRARAGELGAGRPVDLAPEIGQRLALTPEQEGRLADAVDRAELSGIRRAMVTLDGRQLVVDVESRLVVSDDPMGEHGVLAGIDGVVLADASEPASNTASPDLLELLAGRR